MNDHNASIGPITDFMLVDVKTRNASNGNTSLSYFINRQENFITDLVIAEVLAFDDDLNDEQAHKINLYLSQKWGLTEVVDSDGDGNFDDNDCDPADENSYVDLGCGCGEAGPSGCDNACG